MMSTAMQTIERCQRCLRLAAAPDGPRYRGRPICSRCLAELLARPPASNDWLDLLLDSVEDFGDLEFLPPQTPPDPGPVAVAVAVEEPALSSA
jgi:hypothetical protein